jgi:hypothetical protein
MELRWKRLIDIPLEIPKEYIQPPPVDWAMIKQRNQTLLEGLRKMLPEDSSSIEMDLLGQNLRADRDYGCNKRPLRLLSLGASYNCERRPSS